MRTHPTSRRGQRFLRVSLFVLLGAAACGPDGCSCDPATGGSGSITDNRVRACDVLLEVQGEEVPRVSFDEAVHGEAIPRAPRVALSFAARADQAIDGREIFRLQFSREPVPATLVRAECFDAQGQRIDGTPIRFE